MIEVPKVVFKALIYELQLLIYEVQLLIYEPWIKQIFGFTHQFNYTRGCYYLTILWICITWYSVFNKTVNINDNLQENHGFFLSYI